MKNEVIIDKTVDNVPHVLIPDLYTYIKCMETRSTKYSEKMVCKMVADRKKDKNIRIVDNIKYIIMMDDMYIKARFRATVTTDSAVYRVTGAVQDIDNYYDNSRICNSIRVELF